MVDLTLRILLHGRLRCAITIAGVAFAVSLIFVQTGLFLGAMDSASAMIDHAHGDLWVTSRNVAGVDFARIAPRRHCRPHPRSSRFGMCRQPHRRLRHDRTPQWLAGAARGRWGGGLPPLGIPWQIQGGDIGDLRRGPYFFLDESADRRFSPIRVGEYRERLGRRFRIVGRTAGALSFTTTPIASMDVSRLRELQPEVLTGRTHYMLVCLAPGADPATVRAALRRQLPYRDVLPCAEWAERPRRYCILSIGLGFNMYLTVLLGALVGVVIVAQVLYGATMERLPGFGTLKATGGSTSDIYGILAGILAKQAVLVAIAGCVAAELPAWLLRPALHRDGLKLIIPVSVHAAAAVGAIAFCLAGPMILFRKVARLDPALVFRTWTF
jgi:putative ABC transport system permease protein